MENRKSEKSVKIKTQNLTIPVNKLSSSSDDSPSSSFHKQSFSLFKRSSSPRTPSNSNESLKSPKKLSPKQGTSVIESTVSYDSVPSIELIDDAFFGLDLETIIDPDDSTSYGATLAYCSTNFIKQQQMMGMYANAEALTTSQYSDYKIALLNKTQIDKITIIKALIALLNNAYRLVKRSGKEHEEISEDILSISLLSMSSSHDKWKSMLIGMTKTSRYATWREDVKPSDHTASLWEGIEFGIMLQKAELQEYKELIKKLVTAMEYLFILDEKIKKLVPQSKSNGENIAYITLDKIEALCQPSLKRELRKQFIKKFTEENKSSEMQFASLHDLFSSIYAQKDNMQPESLPYECVGNVLKRAYPEQYHHFMQSVSTTYLEAENRYLSFSK